MPVGKGYKPSMKKHAKGPGGHSAKSASLPSGKVGTKAKKKFNAKAFHKMKTKVFALAKKEEMGKA